MGGDPTLVVQMMCPQVRAFAAVMVGGKIFFRMRDWFRGLQIVQALVNQVDTSRSLKPSGQIP